MQIRHPGYIIISFEIIQCFKIFFLFQNSSQLVILQFSMNSRTVVGTRWACSLAEAPKENAVITHKRTQNIRSDQVETSSSRGSTKRARGIRPLLITDRRPDSGIRQVQLRDRAPASSGALADNTFRSAGNEDGLERDTGRVGGSEAVFLSARAFGIVEIFLKGDVGVMQQALLGFDGDGIAAQVGGGFAIGGVDRVPVGRAWAIIDGGLFTHLAKSMNSIGICKVDVLYPKETSECEMDGAEKFARDASGEVEVGWW